MALNRKTKKALKAYIGWKGFKGAAKLAAGAAAGYGLFRIFQGRRLGEEAAAS